MLTIGTTFYNNPDYLLRYVERNLPHVDEMIIVDDGSPIAITEYLKPSKKLRLFRVPNDIGFNSHGCRNLIMKQTSNPWTILMDIDREFIYPEESYDIIKSTKLNPKTLYRFVAHSSMDESHKSVNDYLIHKEHFFSAGGYDEEIAGERWGDREYFEQLAHFGNEKILYGVDMLLTRIPSTHLGSVSPKDKVGYNREARKTVQRRMKNPEPNKPIIMFDWFEIL